jgi:YesN/AraC family two-component response regulator
VIAVSGILIVDDNQSIRHLLRSFVESKTKFPVCGEASNGMEAIEQAEQLLGSARQRWHEQRI